jgi:manganese efflux pump family protein
VSVGVGMRGISTGMKIRIGIAFASAEIIMNLIGAGLGAVAGRLIGDAAGYLGFAALIGVGCYMIYEARRDLQDRAPLDLSQGWGLLLASISISLDSLGIGFSILYIGVPLVISLGTIFGVSVAATTLGLALGRRLGSIIEDRAELLAGILLTLTGVAFALFKALHIG